MSLRLPVAVVLLALASACARDEPVAQSDPQGDLELCSPLRSLDRHWELSVHPWGGKRQLVVQLREAADSTRARPMPFGTQRLSAYVRATLSGSRLELDLPGGKPAYTLLKPQPNLCVLRRVGQRGWGSDARRDTFVGSKQF